MTIPPPLTDAELAAVLALLVAGGVPLDWQLALLEVA